MERQESNPYLKINGKDIKQWSMDLDHEMNYRNTNIKSDLDLSDHQLWRKRLKDQEILIDKLTHTMNKLEDRHRRDLEQINISRTMMQHLEMQNDANMEAFKSLVNRLTTTYEAEIARLQNELKDKDQLQSESRRGGRKSSELEESIEFLQWEKEAVRDDRDRQMEKVKTIDSKLMSILSRSGEVLESVSKDINQRRVDDDHDHDLKEENERLKKLLNENQSVIKAMTENIKAFKMKHQKPDDKQECPYWQGSRKSSESECAICKEILSLLKQSHV